MGCVQAVTGKRVCSEKIPDRIDSDKKPSPFVNPISAAIKSGQLKLKSCPKLGNGDAIPFCKDEYVYHPKTAETCGQFRLKFNIPNDYKISKCKDNNAPLVVINIDEEDLRNFVNNQSGW